MIPAVIGLASGTILLLSRGEETPPPLHVALDSLPHQVEDIEPPLGLTRKQWLAFLRAASCGTPKTISPAFRLGVFGLTVRRLCDLGAMVNPRVIHYKGRQVWDAHWRNPANLKTFQATPMAQYRLFVESIKGYSESPEIAEAIGRTVEGEQITRSGALMVAHRAGLPGMASWLADPEIRQRFSDNTTAFFQRANGIF